LADPELRQAVESLREELRAPAPDHELREAVESLREELRTSTPASGPGEAIEGLRELSESQSQRIVEAVEALAARQPQDQATGDLRSEIEALREELRGAADSGIREAVESLKAEIASGARVPTGDGAEATDLDERVAEIRQEVERATQDLTVRTTAEVDQLRDAVQGWMKRFGDLLEIALQSRAGDEQLGDMEGLGTALATIGVTVQQNMSRVETALFSLSERVDALSGGPPSPVQGPPPGSTQGMPEPPPVEAPATDAAGEASPTEGAEPEVAAPPEAGEVEATEAEESEPEPPSEEAPAPPAADEQPAPSPPPGAEQPQQGDEQPQQGDEQPQQGDERRPKRLPDLWSWGPRKDRSPSA
jgi:hypothetical protein